MMQNWIGWSIQTYRMATVFLVAGFAVASIPILTEALQHFVEYRLGMFNSADGIVGEIERNLRLAVGSVKVLSIMAIAIILPRYFLHDRSLKKALAFSATARRTLFLATLSFMGLFAFTFYLGPILIESIVDAGIAVPTNWQRLLPLLIGLMILFWIQIKYAGAMATMFDDEAMSEAETKRFNRLTGGQFLPVAIVTVLPLMVIHYQLNFLAVDQGLAALAAILVVDSIVVGMLACLLGALSFAIYQAARERD